MSDSIRRRVEALERGNEPPVEFIVIDRRGTEREVFRADAWGLSFARQAGETEQAFIERIQGDARKSGRGYALVLERDDCDG
jgi:hypothetical protein